MAIKITAEAAGVELALTFVELGKSKASAAWHKYAQKKINEMASQLENLQIDLRAAMWEEFCTKCGGLSEECTDCGCDNCGSHVNECECTETHHEDCKCYDCRYWKEIRDTEHKDLNSNDY